MPDLPGRAKRTVSRGASGAASAIAGVDEAGRGPLAGPVFAAAVILDPRRPIRGVADSKTLPEGRREELAILIRERALAFAVAFATVAEIDRINILRASLLAMRRAVNALTVLPGEVWVDGDYAPSVRQPVRTFIGGDATIPAISAASILAKTSRDAVMRGLAAEFPEYGFERHKGYATEEHRAALFIWGPCQHHRRSYAPVQEALELHGAGLAFKLA
jgi:ribonuclease HII